MSRLLSCCRALVALALVGLLSGCSRLVVLNPVGDVAAQQGQLVMIATGLMLLIIVPVIALTLLFAWRYRQSSPTTESDYAPDWHHSVKLELVIWSVPLLIIIVLGALTWIFTHKLDPYRSLDRLSADQPLPADARPLDVQVVALDWKWLFVLPEQGIASVNELAVPVNRPIHFTLTSSTTMNAFYVPDLAGMIYTMAGMQTELNAVINKTGSYYGMSSHYSGYGFSGMHFRLLGMDEQGFQQWVRQARGSGEALTRASYQTLAEPTESHPVQRFASVEPGLYDRVLNMCVADGQACMHDVMALDAQRNRNHTAGLILANAAEQRVCTVDPTTRLN